MGKQSVQNTKTQKTKPNNNNAEPPLRPSASSFSSTLFFFSTSSSVCVLILSVFLRPLFPLPLRLSPPQPTTTPEPITPKQAPALI